MGEWTWTTDTLPSFLGSPRPPLLPPTPHTALCSLCRFAAAKTLNCPVPAPSPWPLPPTPSLPTSIQAGGPQAHAPCYKISAFSILKPPGDAYKYYKLEKDLGNTSLACYYYVVAVQSISLIWLIATPWAAAYQAPLSSTVSEFVQIHIKLQC